MMMTEMLHLFVGLSRQKVLKKIYFLEDFFFGILSGHFFATLFFVAFFCNSASFQNQRPFVINISRIAHRLAYEILLQTT